LVFCDNPCKFGKHGCSLPNICWTTIELGQFYLALHSVIKFWKMIAYYAILRHCAMCAKLKVAGAQRSVKNSHFDFTNKI